MHCEELNGILTDLQGGDDVVEGEENLGKELNNDADDIVLKRASDCGDVGEEHGDFADESGQELDDEDDLGLDGGDDLGVLDFRITAGDARDSGVDDQGVLLDLDEGDLQLLVDDIVGAAAEPFNAGKLVGDVRDAGKLCDRGRSGRRGREKGGKGDETEVEETHLDYWVLDYKIKESSKWDKRVAVEVSK